MGEGLQRDHVAPSSRPIPLPALGPQREAELPLLLGLKLCFNGLWGSAMSRTLSPFPGVLGISVSPPHTPTPHSSFLIGK